MAYGAEESLIFHTALKMDVIRRLMASSALFNITSVAAAKLGEFRE